MVCNLKNEKMEITTQIMKDVIDDALGVNRNLQNLYISLLYCCSMYK